MTDKAIIKQAITRCGYKYGPVGKSFTEQSLLDDLEQIQNLFIEYAENKKDDETLLENLKQQILDVESRMTKNDESNQINQKIEASHIRLLLAINEIKGNPAKQIKLTAIKYAV